MKLETCVVDGKTHIPVTLPFSLRPPVSFVATMARLFGLSNIPTVPLLVTCVAGSCMAEIFRTQVYIFADLGGPSMHPTLPAQGSEAIINPRYRYGRNCKVGDLVQYKNPYFANDSALKRIIGMPGDFVVFDENVSVSVGGAKGSWTEEKQLEKRREEPKMIQVPEGHVWVLGDNMAFSRDSRFFGPLPMALIQGKMEYNWQGWLTWKSFRGDQMVPVPTEEVE